MRTASYCGSVAEAEGTGLLSWASSCGPGGCGMLHVNRRRSPRHTTCIQLQIPAQPGKLPRGQLPAGLYHYLHGGKGSPSHTAAAAACRAGLRSHSLVRAESKNGIRERISCDRDKLEETCWSWEKGSHLSGVMVHSKCCNYKLEVSKQTKREGGVHPAVSWGQGKGPDRGSEGPCVTSIARLPHLTIGRTHST